ncbi:MAG TPA: HmuY family protein [Burkholderiaceae bacterium]|nr:HmuY family protein [Burkholderiaceae bacterium]
MAFETRLVLGATLIATALAGCGGGGGGDDDSGVPPPDPTPTSKFTQSASWTVALPAAGGARCYDFDTQTEVADCSGSNWDLKVESGGRSAALWTNSGVSGAGRGGAFGGPFDRNWTELSTWQDATVDPVDGAMPAAVYFADSANGVFTGTNPTGVAAFEYDLSGQHQFHPNYRVFLITTDSSSADAIGTPAAPVYALQVIGYYGGPTGTASGYPTIRWVDRSAPAVVRTETIDASSNTAWTYFDLTTGTVVPESGTWHIAFNRYNVKLNGGDSGTGNVAGYVGKTPAGLYDANGAPITSAFLAATPATTLAELTAADIAVPTRAQDWVEDEFSSQLQADYRGTYPQPLDFGWYVYYPTAQAAQAAGLAATAHLLAANPEGAALLRSGEGNSYARFHVTKIEYADPSNFNSAQTWTI